jgi:hypothetical protein
MFPSKRFPKMPKKTGRVATADKIATLLRIYRAAVQSGDDGLRQSAFDELKSKYGVDLALVDPKSLPMDKGGD